MNNSRNELLRIAEDLEQWAERGNQDDIQKPLRQLRQAAEDVKRAWSGSWLGYHANVYYRDFQPRPARAHFSQLSGLKHSNFDATNSDGEWVEFSAEEVADAIHTLAGICDMNTARSFDSEASNHFHRQRLHVLSILEIEAANSDVPFLSMLGDEVKKLSTLTQFEIIDYLKPRGAVMTGDYLALGQGDWVPPHISILSEVQAVQNTIDTVMKLAELARHAAEHVSLRQRQQHANVTIGSNVFVGHGSSTTWLQLKEFIENRLKLTVDEFNGVPTAGVTNIKRLSDMLDNAAFAFLVLTGEDEQPSGQLHARMNVVHEAGLFQGRLGFGRAIVLLEEDCEEFSNISGLGQIRFPKGSIESKFEEIRKVLERENLLNSV